MLLSSSQNIYYDMDLKYTNYDIIRYVRGNVDMLTIIYNSLSNIKINILEI